MTTASTHIPTLLLSKNNSEFFVMDFRKRQPKVVLKAEEHEVDRILPYGRKSQILVGIKESKSVKIWVKKNTKDDDDSQPYAELFDLPIAAVKNVHLTPDLRQLWVDVGESGSLGDSSPGIKESIGHLQIFQMNFVNNPHIRTHKYLNQTKSELKYLSDGFSELFVDNYKVVLIDKVRGVRTEKN